MTFNTITNSIKNKIESIQKAAKKKNLKIKDITLIPEFEKLLAMDDSVVNAMFEKGKGNAGDEKGKASEIIGKQLGVSSKTVEKARVVLKEATEEQKKYGSFSIEKIKFCDGGEAMGRLKHAFREFKNDSENKKFMDKLNASAMQQEWELEESCIQEFYSNILFNMHYKFTHKGYEYFITFDSANKKQIWTIYERDLTNPKYCYNIIWETEPRTDFSDIPSLVFGFKLKNDGRTIAEYCSDYWKHLRLLVPEPINESLARKIWRH